MNNGLKISVVIPTFNSESFICRAIDSVRNQSFPAHEILIIDDGSTDSTRNIIRHTYKNEIILLVNGENRGAAAARNIGIEASKGEWIAFLDADDVWETEHLASLVKIIKRHSLKWCCGQHKNIRNGKVVPRHHNKWKDIYRDGEYFDNFFLAWSLDPPIITSGMIVLKKILIQVGKFDESLPVAEDIDLWFKIAYMEPKIGMTKVPTVKHFIRPSSLCALYNKRARLLLDLLEKHIAKASEYVNISNTSFQHSAKKIASWIVNFCIRENETITLKQLTKRHKQLIKKEFPLLSALSSVPFGVFLYCTINSAYFHSRVWLRYLISNLGPTNK